MQKEGGERKMRRVTVEIEHEEEHWNQNCMATIPECWKWEAVKGIGRGRHFYGYEETKEEAIKDAEKKIKADFPDATIVFVDV